jgi:hypothetical protein
MKYAYRIPIYNTNERIIYLVNICSRTEKLNGF